MCFFFTSPTDILRYGPEINYARHVVPDDWECLLCMSSPMYSELNSCSIPIQWKSGEVIPVYKRKGDRANFSNYRPITVTSAVCRIFESILSNNVRLNHRNFFSKSQYGFISRRSCELQLLKSISEWEISLQKHQALDVVYFDFARAFDKVSHSELIKKLHCMGLHVTIID